MDRHVSTTADPDILCIGAVLWDTIGRAEVPMPAGADLPGRVTRLPGGVAFNIASTLRQFAMAPALLTAIGDDPAGDELITECERRGLDTTHVHRAVREPTDRYLAIEDARGLVAAIADARTLERAGARILAPLVNGRLGSPASPWRGLIALDGNLTDALLADIASSPAFAAADLRVAPASPGKVTRLRPLLSHPRATLYVNREEAGLLCGGEFADAAAAAEALLDRGVRRVLVTDGARPCADGKLGDAILAVPPPPVARVNRVTGAGDTFMAAHIAAEKNGTPRREALDLALAAASRYVTGEIGS